MFELRCVDRNLWGITDGQGVCPDCSALVLDISIDDHARWHEQLICQLLAVCAHQDQFSELTLELHAENPGECVRLMHRLQVAGLGERS